MVRLVIELDDEIHQAIKVKAAQEGRSIKAVTIDLFKKWLVWPKMTSPKGPRLQK